jgi:kumamolisin
MIIYMTSIILTITPNDILTINDIKLSAEIAGLQTVLCSSTVLDVYNIENNSKDVLDSWVLQYSNNEFITYVWKEHCKKPKLIMNDTPIFSPVQYDTEIDTSVNARRSLNPSFFNMAQITSIYNIPPHTDNNIVVGVISFGGGLYGTLSNNGTFTNGDVQQYWLDIGIPSINHAKVIIHCVDGATNNPNLNDGGATLENTIDVQIIGSTCKSSKLIIILYIFPYSWTFFSAFHYMYNMYINVNGAIYKPNILSCSWGISEIYVSNFELYITNALFKRITDNNINITAASGDYGSSDNVPFPGVYVNFPSSSPYVTAVGGTSLISPNYIYDTSTIETAWINGGGGISDKFLKPSYQININTIGRSTPDIAACSDPNTGIVFRINGLYYIIGGTSVASPLISGFLAAINFKKFINPILYTIPNTSFHDIVTGTNGDYNANIGYDNCTGLGSIDATVLQQNLNLTL